MAVKDLKKFGELRKVFRGNGSVEFSDGSSSRARFTLGQLTNTDLLISADIERSPLNFQTGQLEADSLQGTLIDGRSITATGLWIKESRGDFFGNKTKLIAYSGYWKIGSPSDGQASVIFELVNFLYLGTEPERQLVNGLESITRSLMTLALGDRQVQLRWATDYKQAVAMLSARRGVRVTCAASTTIESQSEIENAISVIDTLCDIMSVARGTLVSWTSFEVHAVDAATPYSQYRNSVTRSYAGIELINHNDDLDTQRFLEEGFRKCKELNSQFKVRKIARSFIETRAGAFSESRSLQIAVLAEYLANVRARLQKRSYFLDPDVFAAGWESFADAARLALQTAYPGVKNKRLDTMFSNIEGQLNRRSLRWKIEDLARWLEIDLTPDEIRNFIETRDLLAHEGRYPDSGTPEEHYKRMQHLLDRIVLRLFGYRGPYYDFEHGKERTI